MNKNEFLNRLKEDLSSLSDEERLNALKYYEEYFADAGEEMEEEIITEFVSPEDLAHKIEEELAESKSENENILKLDMEIPEAPEPPVEVEIVKEEEKEEPVYRYTPVKTSSESDSNMWKIILILCTAPVWLPLLIALGSVAFGLFMALLGIAFAVAALALSGFIMVGAGFLSVGYGIVYMFIDVFKAFYPLGAGLVVAGLGIIIAYLFTKLAGVMFKSQFKFVGWAVRGITNAFSGKSV